MIKCDKGAEETISMGLFTGSFYPPFTLNLAIILSSNIQVFWILEK
jgi:hypothetical protein